MKKVTVEAEDTSKGMTPEEVMKALAPQGGNRTLTNLTARIGFGGKIKSLTWLESSL